MQTKEDLKDIHTLNVRRYEGKLTDKGRIEKVVYLTFLGGSGGRYSNLPELGGKGLVCAQIGSKNIPIGELQFKNK